MQKARIILDVIQDEKGINTSVDIKGTLTISGMLKALLSIAHSLTEITGGKFEFSPNNSVEIVEEGP